MTRQLRPWTRRQADDPACRSAARFAAFVFIAGFCSVGWGAPDSAQPDLERRFNGTVRPFVETYCLTCHGQEKPKADFDLSPYATMTAVARDHERWEMVLEKLQSAEMPPKKAKQHPTPELRKEIIAWLEDVRRDQAKRNAGDPGPVLARRLSNAEYDYTIRDLTGVDIQPTKTFPVDPANQAGFDNSGESLAMSPALLKKYFQAARLVSEYLVLKPDGFEFAPHPVVGDTDRDKWAVLRIVSFYQQQPTDYAEYFAAAWRYQNRAAFGSRNLTLGQAAAEAHLSPKYLELIWSTLANPNETIGPIAKVQAAFRDLPAPQNGREPEPLRSACRALRDYVMALREKIIPEVKNLAAPPIPEGSQTFVLWKDRQMAANRRRYDTNALQVAGAPVVEKSISEPPRKRAGTNETPNAGGTNAFKRHVQAPTPSVVQKGGKSLAPQLLTKESSATTQMAAAKNRAGDSDLVLPDDPAEAEQFRAAFARFASVFPDAFYITERARVYMDASKEQENAGRLLSAGLHSMTGYFRDDGPLYDLILNQAQQRELDALWQQFDFAASVPQRMHTSFVWFERTDSAFLREAEFDPFRPEDKSIMSQEKIRKLGEIYLAKAERNNAGELAKTAIREHFALVAANILRVEQQRIAAEPGHLKAIEDFAERAYRRPLAERERTDLREFYRLSRSENGLDHEEAVRDCIMRVLMSPNFCYRIDLVEAAGAGGRSKPGSSSVAANFNARPLSEFALANRLSYFLWSSMPDDELLAHARSGDLHERRILLAQVRRMLKNGRVKNFVTEFAGNWLDFRRFEEHNSVDRERFPVFDNELRQAMFDEPVRFIEHVISAERPITDLLYADYTFANASLAKHYGFKISPKNAADWQRVDHADEFGRGGLLPMAVFLTANSPGLRTSPVKRGNWVARRILGEKIPPPPAIVPALPADEKSLGDLTLRETLAKHRNNEACAGCHARFDSFGLVFENYGPVGERRALDFAGHPVDTRAEFPNGTEERGVEGLRRYLRQNRQEDFVMNLSSKLLTYALGRTIMISDDSTLAQMKAALESNDYRFASLVETIVTSPQFLNKRVPENLARN